MPSAQVMADDPLRGAIEILPDRLYYNVLRHHPASDVTRNGRDVHHFSIDDELVYWNFFLDFGPLNLGQLYRFCTKLNSLLGVTPKMEDDRYASAESTSRGGRDDIICYYSSPEPQKRANAIFLLCAWKILFLDQTPEESFYPFRSVNTTFKYGGSNAVGGGGGPMNPHHHPQNGNGSSVLSPIPPFHDASPGVCTYELTVLDVLRGLAKARTYHFFQDFKSGRFNVDEYEHFEMVENGDLNWIIDGQFLAFAGPQNRREVSREGYVTLTPNDYIGYFQQRNVGLVVRLNKKCYDEKKFIAAGINHAEHFYLDGSCPSKQILSQVLSSFERCIFMPGQLRRSGKAVAVHCKAGLGRTGTCIGAYMMKHYKFTAAEAIGWMRLCRPGCVIGPQQHFLQDIEQQMWEEGDIMRQRIQRALDVAYHHGKNGSNGNEEDAVVDTTGGRKKATRSSPRLKGPATGSKRGISNAFHSMSIRAPAQHDMDDAVLGRAGQGDALRAARSRREPTSH